MTSEKIAKTVGLLTAPAAETMVLTQVFLPLTARKNVNYNTVRSVSIFSNLKASTAIRKLLAFFTKKQIEIY